MRSDSNALVVRYLDENARRGWRNGLEPGAFVLENAIGSTVATRAINSLVLSLHVAARGGRVVAGPAANGGRAYYRLSDLSDEAKAELVAENLLGGA